MRLNKGCDCMVVQPTSGVVIWLYNSCGRGTGVAPALRRLGGHVGRGRGPAMRRRYRASRAGLLSAKRARPGLQSPFRWIPSHSAVASATMCSCWRRAMHSSARPGPGATPSSAWQRPAQPCSMLRAFKHAPPARPCVPLQAAAAGGESAAPSEEDEVLLHFVTFMHKDGRVGRDAWRRAGLPAAPNPAEGAPRAPSRPVC